MEHRKQMTRLQLPSLLRYVSIGCRVFACVWFYPCESVNSHSNNLTYLEKDLEHDFDMVELDREEALTIEAVRILRQIAESPPM
jgi:hypothetical protein